MSERTRLEELSDVLDWNLRDVINHFTLEYTLEGEWLEPVQPLTQKEREKVTTWIHELGGKRVENGWLIPNILEGSGSGTPL